MAAEDSLSLILPIYCLLWRNWITPELGICKIPTQLQEATVKFFQVMGVGDQSNTTQTLPISDPKARKNRLVLACKWNYSVYIALESSKKKGKTASCFSHRARSVRCLLTLPVNAGLSSCSSYQLRLKEVMSVAQWFENVAQWIQHVSESMK